MAPTVFHLLEIAFNTTAVIYDAYFGLPIFSYSYDNLSVFII